MKVTAVYIKLIHEVQTDVKDIFRRQMTGFPDYCAVMKFCYDGLCVHTFLVVV